MKSGTKKGHLVAALLPAACLVMLVAKWGVALPYWDQFALVPLLADLEQGRLDLAAVWAPHNEHRLFVPQLTMLSLASLSQWNIHWELAFQVLLAGGILALVLTLLRPVIRGRAGVGAVFLASLLVFSPSQWENWIWGWQIQIFLVVLAAVGTVAALARPGRPAPRIGLAGLAAAVGSFSFANGLLLWPLAAPLVALPPDEDVPRWKELAVWSVLGVVVWAAYFHGFRPGVGDESELGLARRILEFGAYVILYLASPLLRFHDHLALWGGAVAVGAAGVAMTWGTWALRRRFRSLLPWLTLAAFAAASAALTGVGRMELGIGQALSSRYVTIGNLFWIGFLGWLLVAGREIRPSMAWLQSTVLAVVAAALLVNAAHGVLGFRDGAVRRAEILETIVRAPSPGEIPDATLEEIFPAPGEARNRLETLRELGMGPYRDREVL